MDPSLLSNSSSLPSIFELLAQSSLRSLLQPAFTHLLTLGANHYPRRLIPLAERHEEVWTVLLALIERWSLLKHGAASFPTTSLDWSNRDQTILIDRAVRFPLAQTPKTPVSPNTFTVSDGVEWSVRSTVRGGGRSSTHTDGRSRVGSRAGSPVDKCGSRWLKPSVSPSLPLPPINFLSGVEPKAPSD